MSDKEFVSPALWLARMHNSGKDMSFALGGGFKNTKVNGAKPQPKKPVRKTKKDQPNGK